MGTIANAKVTHYYNCYNGDFIGCLRINKVLRLYRRCISAIYSKCFEYKINAVNQWFVIDCFMFCI